MRPSSYTLKTARKDLPTRNRTSHKVRAGKCLIIAGSEGMWGAAILTSQAATRVGSGYVYLHSDTDKFPVEKHPDFLIVKTLQKNSIRQFSSVAIGPGLRKDPFVESRLRQLLQSKFAHVVADAGALRALANMKAVSVPNTWILTPHEGELADLLGISSDEVRRDRLAYVHLAQQIFGCILLLKGHRTLVANENKIWEVQSGNAALAKAGTGDVLTGIIAGFLAQGVTPRNAACLGAFVHGFIADEWIRESNDILSLTPLDLLQRLPQDLRKIRSSASRTIRSRRRGSSNRDL